VCERIALPGGGVAIVCGGHRRRRPRCACGAPATLECDGQGPPALERRGAVVAKRRRSCDQPLCSRCAIHVPPDQDYCRRPACRAAAAAAGAQLRLFTTTRR
jgi:hypothetical protein